MFKFTLMIMEKKTKARQKINGGNAWLVLILFFVSLGLQGQTSIYTNDMAYVLGDVKQGFIQNKITKTSQVDNLLKGFSKLKVNGIRIPIFASGLTPDSLMLDYFIREAGRQGFPLFANPAQSSGGQRIANGVLNADANGGPVINDPAKTAILIARIVDFAQLYSLKWINPFNEDGRPESAWSTDQINTIYASLKGNLNGAELIGSCVWGLGAGILLMKNTEIADHITVATTHNLGFEHSKWPEFIALAKAKNLPVWDSETNNNDKYGTGTRIQVAVDAGVDGLVLYNSWNTISMTTGEINTAGKNLMEIYLKPVAAANASVDANLKKQIQVFPNPCTTGVQIKGVDEGAGFCVYNSLGKQVLCGNSKVINTTGLTPGFYVLLTNGMSCKFIKE